ncbi:MAG: DUF2071 domain-containing protein [Actinomycetota bacterium]
MDVVASAPAGERTVESITADPPPLSRRRVLGQRWTELGYFHWPFEPTVVQATLPRGLRVDTFEGMAWVGVVPFVMRDVAVGRGPSIPYFGTFVEINLRTYVIDTRGRRSVWFYSLDVPRLAVVGVARSMFSLPYCWSATRFTATGDTRAYAMRRRWPRDRPASATIAFRVGEPVTTVTELDHFLTARWSLATARDGRIYSGRVEHPRWPLHEVTDYRVDGDLFAPAGLPLPTSVAHTACSPGVPVDIAWLERVDAAAH